ncbi:MAG: Gx transporter family protein [Rectinemataceae bacterium]
MQRSTERFSDKADVTALLGAFCFFLSAVEYMLPKPMPFMRLGIANLPILLAVDILPFRWYLILAAVKVIGMSLLSGTLFSYIALFSLAGTMAAALAMWALRHAGGRFISQIGVSIAGAMVSNAVQVLIARYLVFRETAWLIAPLFLGMGLITGAALGVFAEHFARVSIWYAKASGLPDPEGAPGARRKGAGTREEKSTGEAAEKTAGQARKEAARAKKKERKDKTTAARARRRERTGALFSPGSLALAGLVVMIAFLRQDSLIVKAALLVVFALAAWASGKRFSLVTTLSVSLGIVLANLIVPSGRVLATVSGFRLTQGALFEGIEKALTFEGLMMLSKASIMSGLRLPGRIGRIVAAAFTYYDRIIEYKGKIRPATLAMDADDLMLRVWESAARETAPSAPSAPSTSFAPSASLSSAAPAGTPTGRNAGDTPGETATRRKGIAILAAVAAIVWALSIFLP